MTESARLALVAGSLLIIGRPLGQSLPPQPDLAPPQPERTVTAPIEIHVANSPPPHPTDSTRDAATERKAPVASPPEKNGASGENPPSAAAGGMDAAPALEWYTLDEVPRTRRTLVIYSTPTNCAPCIVLERTLADPRVQQALRGWRLARMDDGDAAEFGLKWTPSVMFWRDTYWAVQDGSVPQTVDGFLKFLEAHE